MLETLAWIGLGASIVPAHRAARRSSSVLAALITIEAIAVSLCLLALVREDTWSAIAQEDGLVEWATFLAYMMAAGWLAIVVRTVSPSRWFKVACLLLAAFCVVVAGEEISWGQRLLGFRPPDVFLERNFQQELNLHNVLMSERGLGFKLESKHLVIVVVLGFCSAWPWLVRRKRFEVFAPLAPPLAFAPLALAVAAAEMSYAVELTGEGAELIGGLIFLASALVAADQRRETNVIGWLLAPCILGLVVSAVVAHVMFGSDDDGSRVAATELATLQRDVVAGASDKLRRRNIHKRAFTSVRDGYLRLSGGEFLGGKGTPAATDDADPRRDRHGYFLDPWNNPYWVHYNKKTGTGAVYSFGPNRRRDVKITSASSDPGDDIIVRFTLAKPGAQDDADAPAETAPP